MTFRHDLTVNLVIRVDQTILALLTQLVQGEQKIMAILDDLTAQVTKNTDAEQSAIVLLTQLGDLLRNAGTDPTKIQAIITQLDSSKEALAAAVVANTPAAATA